MTMFHSNVPPEHMTTATRIYCVHRNNDAPGAPPRLVRASHAAQALRHVANGQLTVKVATQDELVRALECGCKVELPGADHE